VENLGKKMEAIESAIYWSAQEKLFNIVARKWKNRNEVSGLGMVVYVALRPLPNRARSLKNWEREIQRRTQGTKKRRGLRNVSLEINHARSTQGREKRMKR